MSMTLDNLETFDIELAETLTKKYRGRVKVLNSIEWLEALKVELIDGNLFLIFKKYTQKNFKDKVHVMIKFLRYKNGETDFSIKEGNTKIPLTDFT